MKTRTLALLFASIATLIYAMNYTIAKSVMPFYIKPYGFMIVLPFGFTEFMEINWVSMPRNIFYAVVFVVVCTTYLIY